MMGVETVIGGAFVSAIIRSIVDTARSYFSDKYNLHKGTKEMLDSLEASLPRILWVLKSAEQKPTLQDEILARWLQQLKDVAYEVEDVMDDFEAKRIRDTLKKRSKVSKIATSTARTLKGLFLFDSDEQNLKDLLGKIKKICDGIVDLTKFIESGNKSRSDGSIGFSTGETSFILPETKKIFGRGEEIELILDMITQKGITDLNLMKNTGNLIANTVKEIKENISEKGKEKAESSDPFSIPQEKVDSIGLESFSLKSDRPSFGDDQFHVTDTIASSKEPKLSNSTPLSSKGISISVGEPSIRILPIVGIGGIGKTTIAQVIYNHSEVKEYFDLQGWVYVTSSPVPRKYLHDILCSFYVGTDISISPITSLSDGHIRIKRTIQHKRFLLVFDDVKEGHDWINSTWKRLIEVLVDGAWGSMVIVTTDFNSIATRIGTLPPVFLDYLPPEQFLGLFEYYAFGHNMKKCYCKKSCKNESHCFRLSQHQETVLKPIGEKIAEKLHGLPLAAEVIGTLLSSKTEREDWEKILESEWWNLELSKHIITPLGIGFQNLDHELKQCFCFCSLFPRNYVFDKDRLAQMWIAHGFIHPTLKEKEQLENEEIKIEDIARSMFDKLVDRFFLQNAIQKNQHVMHDLIRELAIAISSEMLYVSGSRMTDNKTIPSYVRHLAIDSNKDDDFYADHMKWSLTNIKSLRTIMFFGFCKLSEDKDISCILEQLWGLRLLDLSYFTSQLSVPDKCKLSSHLRFLDISFSKIREIPESLCDLVHLQVLDLRGCSFSNLPDGMNKLINLRHLYASPDTISFIRGIGNLTNLQELEEVRIREEEGFRISEISRLNSLNGQLTFTNIEKISSKEKAVNAKLEEKKYLTSLKFDMTPSIRYITENLKHQHHQVILEGLKPHKNIRELNIKKFWWVSFPSWMMELHEMNKLTSIHLEGCRHLETLPPLGSLPLLEILNLSGLGSITCIGKELYGTSNVIFPSLKELTLSYLWKLERWMDPENRQLFPCLQKLKITNCRNLSETPLLHRLNLSVVELHLSECDKVTKNVGIYCAAMTSLTSLYLRGSVERGSQEIKIGLYCQHLLELRNLTIEQIDIVQFKGQISSLINLKNVHFYSCWVESSDRQQNMHCLSSLASIEVSCCKTIPTFFFTAGRFPSLRKLCIYYYGDNGFTSYEDGWLQRLSSLEDLELSNCGRLTHLPPSLSVLSSLKKFTMKNCFNIRSLPEEGLPGSLMELLIIGCSDELMQGCQPIMGAEWSKISHVPCIRVKRRTDR